jgi:hypothetical protein
MYAVEFQTKLQDGKIIVPTEHQEKFKGQVRVILLSEENDEDIDFIDYLLANPTHDPNFVPLKREEIHER